MIKVTEDDKELALRQLLNIDDWHPNSQPNLVEGVPLHAVLAMHPYRDYGWMADILASGKDLRPVSLERIDIDGVGHAYTVSDGIHRVWAYRDAGRLAIPALVSGTYTVPPLGQFYIKGGQLWRLKESTDTMVIYELSSAVLLTAAHRSYLQGLGILDYDNIRQG